MVTHVGGSTPPHVSNLINYTMENLYYVQKIDRLTIYSVDTQSMSLVVHSEHSGVYKMIEALSRLRVEGFNLIEL